MRHIWSVICQYAVEDKSSNNFSLIETISQVSFKGDLPPDRPFPLPFRFSIVSLLCRSSEQDQRDYPLRLRVIGPGADELASGEITARLSEHYSYRAMFSLEVLQYTENGIYEFEIAYRDGDDWHVATQVPLLVTHEQPQPAQTNGEPTE